MQEVNAADAGIPSTETEAVETADTPTSAPMMNATAFPEPPVSDKRQIKLGWKPPAWLMLTAGLLLGLLIGVEVMHHRAVSREIIVSVNGTSITEDQLIAQLQTVGTPAVRKMVQDELQLQFAEKKGLAPSDQQVDEEYDKIKQRPNFEQAFASSGLSEADIKHNLRIQLAQTNVITQGVSVTDAEAQQYYQAQSNPANPSALFYHPPAVSLRAIATATQAKSKQALAELAAQTPFELAASSYSIDASKQNGGLLSPLVLGRSPLHRDPALEQQIFAMKVGDQIGPVFFANQWWIFQCQDKVAAAATPYDQVKDQCLLGAKLLKGKAANGARIQTEFADFQHTANLQAFWPQYQKAIATH